MAESDSKTLMQSFLSQKNIPRRERLIFALDVDSVDEAKNLVHQLGDTVFFYKLGLQLFMAGGYFELLEWLHDKGKSVFVDLKFFDIPQTIESAVRQLKNRKIQFVSVHGNDEILKAAVKHKNGLKILAVTVLTSLDNNDMKQLGFKCDINELVYARAKNALHLGCDGVVSSGVESSKLREGLGENFIIVIPGIRPGFNKGDQKRTVKVEKAFRNGADYIVVGRPIKEAKDPKAKAEEIQGIIASLFD